VSEEFEKTFLSADFSSLMRERHSREGAQGGQNLPFKVCVDDNFHHMDASERTAHGSFATAEEAVEACKRIVQESVHSNYRAGMSAKELFENYKMFGDDPFVISESGRPVEFSAWDYARQLCSRICGK